MMVTVPFGPWDKSRGDNDDDPVKEGRVCKERVWSVKGDEGVCKERGWSVKVMRVCVRREGGV